MGAQPTPGVGEDASREVIPLGLASLSAVDVVAVARGGARLELERDPAYRARLDAGRRALESALRKGVVVYGVTTGVGASQGREIAESDRKLATQNLLRFHGCGTGRILDGEESAAVVVARLASLARGYSGVRPVVLERLCDLVNRRILPRIPEEGSVGASGDLTPLSYVAALLVGEREALVAGEVVEAADALASAGLEPLALEPKESLALMNGTSVMTALACLSVERAARLARWAAALTAMTVRAISGNPRHFDRAIFELKPHPGTRRAGAWIREDLEPVAALRPARLQDVYSVRCAPHVIGVLLDALAFARQVVEIELNSVNDNPIVDPETGAVLHGGNFYGGHVAFAMDGLKSAAAGVADLLDRQMLLLCSPATSGGLPENLTPNGGGNHGFKAMGISTSALTAEALKLTMPAASFSRSTESHNQDKVSMGTIAARDCRRILELAETVAAIVLLADCQALELRGDAAGRTRELREIVRKSVPALVADRRQDLDIERVLALYRTGELRIDASLG